MRFQAIFRMSKRSHQFDHVEPICAALANLKYIEIRKSIYLEWATLLKDTNSDIITKCLGNSY